MRGFSFASFRAGLGMILVAAMILPLAGCGSSGPRTISVTLKITYGGGAWPKEGKVYFGSTQHPGVGDLKTDGTVVAKTWEQSGLVPGTYTIRVECWEESPSMQGNSGISTLGKSYVPEKYGDISPAGFTLEIPPDARSVTKTFDVPKREG